MRLVQRRIQPYLTLHRSNAWTMARGATATMAALCYPTTARAMAAASCHYNAMHPCWGRVPLRPATGARFPCEMRRCASHADSRHMRNTAGQSKGGRLEHVWMQPQLGRLRLVDQFQTMMQPSLARGRTLTELGSIWGQLGADRSRFCFVPDLFPSSTTSATDFGQASTKCRSNSRQLRGQKRPSSTQFRPKSVKVGPGIDQVWAGPSERWADFGHIWAAFDESVAGIR